MREDTCSRRVRVRVESSSVKFVISRVERLKDEGFFNSEVKTSSIEQRNEGMTLAARVPFIVEVRKRAMVEFDDG